MKKNNTLFFEGTNQILDCLIHALAIPWKGFHLGWRLVFNLEYSGILDFIMDNADLSKPLNIEAKSYGCINAMDLVKELHNKDLVKIGTVVLKESPKYCRPKNFKYFKDIHIENYRYGRDIVTFIPPWFSHPEPYYEIPNTKKSWWKFWEWFMDHKRGCEWTKA